jgi:hypothetical protein
LLRSGTALHSRRDKNSSVTLHNFADMIRSATHVRYSQRAVPRADWSTLFHARSDDVVPLAVKLFALDLQFSQSFFEMFLPV